MAPVAIEGRLLIKTVQIFKKGSTVDRMTVEFLVRQFNLGRCARGISLDELSTLTI